MIVTINFILIFKNKNIEDVIVCLFVCFQRHPAFGGGKINLVGLRPSVHFCRFVEKRADLTL